MALEKITREESQESPGDSPVWGLAGREKEPAEEDEGRMEGEKNQNVQYFWELREGECGEQGQILLISDTKYSSIGFQSKAFVEHLGKWV